MSTLPALDLGWNLADCCAGPATALELSQTLQISIALAKQHLLNAELAELLCRDESLQGGVRFYPNFFAHYTLSGAAPGNLTIAFFNPAVGASNNASSSSASSSGITLNRASGTFGSSASSSSSSRSAAASATA